MEDMANREHAHCMGHAMGAKGADACAATTSFEGERQSGAGQSIQAVSGAGALSDQGVCLAARLRAASLLGHLILTWPV